MIRILSRLSTFYLHAPWQLALSLTGALLAAALGLVAPWILKVVLDEGLSQPRPHFFWLAGGLLLAVTLGRGLAIFAYQYFAASLGHAMAYRMRNQLYDHIQHLSFADHDQTRTGELMSRVTADVEAVRMFFHFGLPTLVSIAFTSIGAIVAMAWLDLRFALVTLLSVPMFFGLSAAIGALLRPLQGRVQVCTAELSVALQESLAGIRVVKAFAREPQQIAYVDRASTALYEAYLRVTHVQALNLPLLTLLLSLAIAFTLYVGGQRVIDGLLPLGSLAAATGYLAQLAQPLRRLSWLTGMASRCHAGGERLFEVLDTAPQVRERPQARDLGRANGALHVDRVSFHYANGAPVLRDISFRAEPGTVTAFLGSTGSGKTTLAQLIPRFYDVSSGCITLDGVDLRDVSLASLRRQIGIVMQDTLLFSATIRDNIAYGLDDVSFEAITAAAKAARAHDFILQFPDGYDTWVGERGVTLSGGQRQRIAIARAFVRDPRVLILDDATSSVDMETEWLIQQALADLMAGRTTLVIAQRLRTLKMADVILVLEDGRIVQRGAHRDLLEQPGLYRRIYDLQWRDEEAAQSELSAHQADLAARRASS